LELEGSVMTSAGAQDGCPVCRTALATLCSEPIAERRCPRCWAELWALALPSGPKFFIRRPGQSPAEFLAALVGPALGLSATEIASFLRDADLLDMVEFLAEVEASELFNPRPEA
jgi:hypothetical protein